MKLLYFNAILWLAGAAINVAANNLPGAYAYLVCAVVCCLIATDKLKFNI